MGPWLVSPGFDLAIFLGPAVVAIVLVWIGPIVADDGALPLPLWVVTVLLVDVAHVWATLFRTYLDGTEVRRRPWLYGLTPVVVYGLGVALYARSGALFWTVLAYLAVYHFVRQQYGWVALYARYDRRRTSADRWIDRIAIDLSTLVPLLWWHAHLPRAFAWFVPNDFVHALNAPWLCDHFWMVWVVYACGLLAYVARQVMRRRREGHWFHGKNVVVATTALCWGLGIVVTNSDYAFSVTNVLIHGVPYIGIVWAFGQRGRGRGRMVPGAVSASRSWADWVVGEGRWTLFLGVLFVCAYVEEFGWHRLVWHESLTIFPGPDVYLSQAVLGLVVPLLAVPQATHYVLDGFIWRRSA